MRRPAPYLEGAAAAAAVTALIGLAGHWVDLPSLAAAYIVVVVAVGARSGRLPAIATALVCFVLYDFFFVPPEHTLLVSAPRDVLDLAVLLGAAFISEQVVAALVRRTATAVSEARETRTLYDVALAALRERDSRVALEQVLARASSEPGFGSITVVRSADGNHPDVAPTVLAGEPLSATEVTDARWVLTNRSDLGARLDPDGVTLFASFPPRAATLSLVSGGVAVIRPGGSPPTPDSGRVLGAIVGMVDLLVARINAGEAAVQIERLEESDRLKARVLSALSHELKTPIAALLTGLGALELDPGMPDPSRRLLGSLEAQTRRLDRMVQQVLTMTRLEAGLPLATEPTRLEDALSAALVSLAPGLAGVPVDVELEPDLPPVVADDVQIERVLANLVENAVQWRAPSGRVTIGARARAVEVEAWVENDGPAIAPKDQRAIFDARWTGRRAGSGLGLALSREIVEAHGGTLTVRNTRRGPRFTLTLPAAVATAA